MSTDAGRVHKRVGWAPLRHFTERSVLGLLVVVALGLGFGLLLLLVRVHWGPLQSLDAGVAGALNRLVAPHPPVVTVLEALTDLGGRPVLLWLVLVAVVLLLIRRRTRLAVYVVVTGAGALLLDPSLKTLVGRLRPVVDLPVSAAPGNSFPSGHALGSFVAYGALLLVFLPAVAPRWRKAAIALVATIVVLVGVTRIALGVHFLSDVLAGWLLGAAWLGVTAYAFRLWRREVGSPVRPLEEGLEPEAAHDVTPAPDEEKLLPHPWAGAAQLLVGWVLIFGLLYVLGWAVTNLTEGTWIRSADEGFNRWLQTFRTPARDDFSYLWSKAGDTHMILLVSLVFCPLALALWRRWRPVLFLVLAMFGELSLFLTTAGAVGRPRPPVEQLDGQMPTSSFPSGHIAATMCLYAAIAILVVPRVRAWWRWLFVALAVIMPAGVALSRMYRGMHHPTDFLGAAVLTTCWLSLLWFVLRPNADVAEGNRADAGELGERDAHRDLTETSVPADKAGGGAVTVRFLTWNIRTGGSGGRLDALVTLLRRERPDILALQELRGFPGRRMGQVAGALGMTPFLARSIFGQSVAVLVRPPLRIVGWSGVRWRLHHGAAAVRVPTTAGQLTVVSTHLNALSPHRRMREARFLAARYRPGRGPVLLAGDLNSLDPGTDHTERLAALSGPYRRRHVTPEGSADTRAIAAFTAAGFVDLWPVAGAGDGCTVPTTRGGGPEFSAAGMRLDYLMASPSVAARARHARVLRGAEAEYASDHYPVTVDLDL